MKRICVFLGVFLFLLTGLIYAQEIDLIKQANQAKWTNTDNTQLVFGREGMASGTAAHESNVILEDGETYPQVLFTHPQWKTNGYVQGLFSGVTIPENDPVLVIAGGFKQGAQGTDGAGFSAIILEPRSGVPMEKQSRIRLTDISPGERADCGFHAVYDNKIDRRECSLADYAGKTVGIILQVAAGPSPDNDWAVWTEAKIISSREKVAAQEEEKPKKLLKNLRGHNSRIYDLAFSPNGKQLASASGDNTVRIWNIPSGNLHKVIKGHTAHVFSVDFRGDGNRIVTGSGDRTAQVWQVSSGAQVASFSGHKDRVLGVAFSPNGNQVASVSDDGTGRIWNAGNGNEVQVIQHGKAGVYAVDFHPNGRLIAVGTTNGELGIWNISNGNRVHRMTGHNRAIQKVGFSQNGNRLVSSSADNTVRIWNAGNGNLVQTIQGMPVNSAAISSDGFFVVSGNDGRAFLWKAGNGNRIMPLDHISGSAVRAVAFSPDGKMVAMGGDDGVIRLWQVELER
jgi:WD40 repeat protein